MSRRQSFALLVVTTWLGGCSAAPERTPDPPVTPKEEVDARAPSPPRGRAEAGVTPSPDTNTTTGGGGSGGAGGSSSGTDAAADKAAPSESDASAPADARADAGPGADGPATPTSDGGARDPKLPPPAVPVGGAAPECRFHWCESFENGTDGASPPGWSSSGSIVVSSAQAAFGKKSLRARAGGIVPGNFIAKSGMFPPGKNTVYVRMFVRFESRPSSSSLVHWTAAEVRGSGGPILRAIGGISQFGFKGRNNLMFNIDPGGGEKSVEDTFPYPALRDKGWECIEVMLNRGSPNQVRMHWNDELRPRLNYDGTWGSRFTFPSFGSLALGFGTYQAAGTFEVYIDDVAVHDQRIGCAP